MKKEKIVISFFLIYSLLIVPIIYLLQKAHYRYLVSIIVIFLYGLTTVLVYKSIDDVKKKLIHLYIANIVASIVILPILSYGIKTIYMFFYRGRITFSCLFVCSILLYLILVIVEIHLIIKSFVNRKALCFIPIILMCLVLVGTFLPSSYEEIRKDLFIFYQNIKYSDIEHYELEYRSYNQNEVLNKKNYDSKMIKYETLTETTWGELINDFPLEESRNEPDTIKLKKPNLQDNEKIWVYLSCYKDFTNEVLFFEYNKLELEGEDLSIETHFRKINGANHSETSKDLIVISIIPMNQ